MIDDYTRRRFLRNATVATAAVFLPHTYAETHRSPQRANQLTPTAQSAITLTDCLALTPEEMAATSPRVQQARNYLTQQIATITDQTLQQTISTLYHQPTPLSIARMNDDERRTVWQELRAKGYTDAQENDFLPPLPPQRNDDEAFFSAPGSGYQSHHAYPGGLATHVAANVAITNGIIATYTDVYGYQVERDIALAAQLLHDLHKPYVFPWQTDHASRQEQTLAGTGEHHILSIAELIYREMPPELVVATACAHQPPSNAENAAQIAAWLAAAAIIAGRDPLTYGLVAKHGKGLTLKNIARQEGYICHLGDHDFVLSGPAVKQTLPVIQKIARQDYRIAVEGRTFNALRNRLYAMHSAMRVHHVYLTQGEAAVRELMHATVAPV
ncbi:Tat pathway signal sequence [Edwardsiella hoshinae]|uniref:Tat pathway signal sequence n=1 Tax=Edwardsiella hoshinae TaxID=93378 RepID=A0ABN4T0A0_9GAMM|nr:HD domain-containing protein [Edwardsiella hoshinae]AOV97264.1 Tat pathway signal sequence [Edwardsiella hoshinae]